MGGSPIRWRRRNGGGEPGPRCLERRVEDPGDEEAFVELVQRDDESLRAEFEALTGTRGHRPPPPPPVE